MTWLVQCARRSASAAALLSLTGCAVSGADAKGKLDTSPFVIADGGDGHASRPDVGHDAGHEDHAGLDASSAANPHALDASSDGSTPTDAPHDAAAPESRDAQVALDATGASVADANLADAATREDASTSRVKTLDGVIDGDEWREAVFAAAQVPSDWGPNELTYLAAELDDSYLWLAVRGAVENDKNALVVYLDTVAGQGVAPRDISDQSGEDELDDALSAELDAPAGFLADFAWGTLRMSTDVRGGTAHTGLRGLRTPSDLAWIDTPPPAEPEPCVYSVCSESACEVRIPMATLGGTEPITMFARLTNSDGDAFSNQTLPLDNPDASADVHAVLTLQR
jgi:hypothetical protein